ncbi:MAG: 50S ribosomal protein L32 [bacterium]
MGLPGHRRTSSNKRRRASHFALSKTSTTVCPNCQAKILPHRVCPVCGYYKGRQVVAGTKRLAKK